MALPVNMASLLASISAINISRRRAGGWVTAYLADVLGEDTRC